MVVGPFSTFLSELRFAGDESCVTWSLPCHPLIDFPSNNNNITDRKLGPKHSLTIMEPSPAKPQLYCHTIDSTNASDDAVEQLFNLSTAVFEEFPEEDENSSAGRTEPGSRVLSTWLSNIQHPSAIIAYITPNPTPNPPTALGVFFGVTRTQPEIGYELFHLRVAAVRSESRGLGIFPVLMDRIKRHARNCGHSEMTVCTYPKRFVKMYRILREHGWEEVGRRGNGAAVLKTSL